jgi:hypothetical protein
MAPAIPRGDDVVCEYCGTRDRLPADQRARALELERRLAEAARRGVKLEGMDAALAHVFESRGSYARAAGIYIAAAVLVSASSIANAWPTIVAARSPIGATVHALLGSLWLIGFAIALFAAFAIGRRRYRRHVRPHLLARAPRGPGLPASCRTCGGALARDDRGPFVALHDAQPRHSRAAGAQPRAPRRRARIPRRPRRCGPRHHPPRVADHLAHAPRVHGRDVRRDHRARGHREPCELTVRSFACTSR